MSEAIWSTTTQSAIVVVNLVPHVEEMPFKPVTGRLGYRIGQVHDERPLFVEGSVSRGAIT